MRIVAQPGAKLGGIVASYGRGNILAGAIGISWDTVFVYICYDTFLIGHKGSSVRAYRTFA